jgi:hypothetical protein
VFRSIGARDFRLTVKYVVLRMERFCHSKILKGIRDYVRWGPVGVFVPGRHMRADLLVSDQ